jgi:hypothetical protein
MFKLNLDARLQISKRRIEIRLQISKRRIEICKRVVAKLLKQQLA